MPFFTIYRV